jgi:hypothetical protein
MNISEIKLLEEQLDNWYKYKYNILLEHKNCKFGFWYLDQILLKCDRNIRDIKLKLLLTNS